MDGRAEKKVPGGKLIKIRVTWEDIITHLNILGDFFLHPEEAIELIESSVVGMPVSSTVQTITEKIETVVKEQHIQMLGIIPQDIAETIVEAIS